MGRSLLGIDQLIPIVASCPMMMFAVLFGLSMDYEIFLLSRIREEYLKTGNNVESVVERDRDHGPRDHERRAHHDRGVPVLRDRARPGRQVFGIGLAVAVFIDATLVRIVLVPSTMELLGDANWWLPRLARPHPAEDEPGARVRPRGGGAGAGPGRLDITCASYDDVLLPEEGAVVPVELIQTLVNALLLLVVAFVGGTLGLRRFEAIQRSIAHSQARSGPTSQSSDRSRRRCDRT